MSDLYQDYLNSLSKLPFVSFQGRKGGLDTVGHAFVGIGVQIDAGLRIYERLFGLYPDGGTMKAVKSIFTPVSGKLDESWKDLAWDTEIITTIDDDHRKVVLDLFEEWKGSAPEYSLLANGAMNCSSLVSAVAASVDMRVPGGAGSTRPWVFIDTLKALQ